MNKHTKAEIYLSIKELEDILEIYHRLGIDEHDELFFGAIERLRDLIV